VDAQLLSAGAAVTAASPRMPSSRAVIERLYRLFVVARIMPTCLTTIARCLQSPMSVSISAPSRIGRFVDDDIFDRIATAVSYSRGNRLANDIFTYLQAH